MSRGIWGVAFALALVPACGGSAKGPMSFGDRIDPGAPHRWVTDEVRRFTAPKRCVTGPFEIEVPARDFEFGRRMVVQVHAKRSFVIHIRVDERDGDSMSSRYTVSNDRPDEHSHCRAKADEVASVAGESGEPGGPGDIRAEGGADTSTPDGQSPVPPDPRTGPELEAGGASSGGGDASVKPELVATQGPVDPRWRVVFARGWFPNGNPTEADVDITWIENDDARAGVRLRLWFPQPTDTSGMVFVVHDQRLVPKGSIADYRARLPELVAVRNAHRKLEDKEPDSADYESKCAKNPDQPGCWPIGRVPPPRKQEERPGSPAAHAVWLQGYWSFDRQLDDFVWVPGTYVVRDPPEATAGAGAETQDAELTTTNHPPSEPAKPVVVADEIPPRPKPKHETIPPPPAIVGAVWVAGHWKLDEGDWRWIRGRWKRPRGKNKRFRAPSIELRGEVRVYLPGGWVVGRER